MTKKKREKKQSLPAQSLASNIAGLRGQFVPERLDHGLVLSSETHVCLFFKFSELKENVLI